MWQSAQINVHHLANPFQEREYGLTLGSNIKHTYLQHPQKCTKHILAAKAVTVKHTKDAVSVQTANREVHGIMKCMCRLQ